MQRILGVDLFILESDKWCMEVGVGRGEVGDGRGSREEAGRKEARKNGSRK